jgi:DNA (cytosine-5)-methyltransferase 1
MNELALFAGAGGGLLGGHLLGWRTVCAVEWDAYAASVLVARQNDGVLPSFPIWDDVQTFDGQPWRGIVDVVSGGFPCQDISSAGKGAGIDGERSGMWRHMARIIGEVRPKFVFVENSPLLVSRGLTRVLGDLTEMGYDAKWGVLGAHHVSAPHKRDRIWIMAYADSGRQQQCNKKEREIPKPYEKSYVSNPSSQRGCCRHSKREDAKDAWELRGDKREDGAGMGWWDTEPQLGRVANGVANRVDRLKAIGNGQVPAVARLAWNVLTKNI